MLPAVSFRIFLPPRFKQTLFSHWSPSNTALPFGARHGSPGTFELHQCMDVLLRLKRLLLAYLVPLLGTQSLDSRKYQLTDTGTSTNPHPARPLACTSQARPPPAGPAQMMTLDQPLCRAQGCLQFVISTTDFLTLQRTLLFFSRLKKKKRSKTLAANNQTNNKRQ